MCGYCEVPVHEGRQFDQHVHSADHMSRANAVVDASCVVSNVCAFREEFKYQNSFHRLHHRRSKCRKDRLRDTESKEN